MVVPVIRVYPASEMMRKKLAHPTGIKFRDSLAAGVDWPADSFTYRRLREGAVLETPPPVAKAASAENESAKKDK